MSDGRRDLVKERYWREVLERHSASRLSARVFCRREQLAASAFYAWRRTIAQRDGAAQPTDRSPAFVRLQVSERWASEASIEIALAGGRVLRLRESIPAGRLAELVQALETSGR
jgi:hypothetical protein